MILEVQQFNSSLTRTCQCELQVNSKNVLVNFFSRRHAFSSVILKKSSPQTYRPPSAKLRETEPKWSSWSEHFLSASSSFSTSSFFLFPDNRIALPSTTVMIMVMFTSLVYLLLWENLFEEKSFDFLCFLLFFYFFLNMPQEEFREVVTVIIDWLDF